MLFSCVDLIRVITFSGINLANCRGTVCWRLIYRADYIARMQAAGLRYQRGTGYAVILRNQGNNPELMYRARVCGQSAALHAGLTGYMNVTVLRRHSSLRKVFCFHHTVTDAGNRKLTGRRAYSGAGYGRRFRKSDIGLSLA